MNKFLTNVHSKHVLYSATTVQEQSVGSWTSLGAQKSRRSLIGPSWAGAKQSARGAGHLTLRQRRWTKNNELPYLIPIVDQSSICGCKDDEEKLGWFHKIFDQLIFQLTWHTNASESSSFVNTGSLILARIRFTFVDVDFASSALESFWTITPIWSWFVDTSTAVLARWS